MKKTSYLYLRKCQKFIGKKIKFHYSDERQNDIFIPSHIQTDSPNDDELLLWDNESRWCTLDYAIKNEIK